MAKICTDEKTAVRQRWIENGLLELMQERRFEEITVTELCRSLELSRRSFYRYFDDMEDVLDSLMHHSFQEMVIVSTLPTIPDLERYCAFWLHRKPLLRGLVNSRMYSKIIQYTLKYSEEENLKQCLPSEELRAEINLFVICGLTSLLISWHEEGFQKTPEQMARIAYRMLYKPLLTGS